VIPVLLIAPFGYYYIWGNISKFLINPVLLFLVSYFIGKRIVLKFGISSVIIPLFLGSLVGSMVLFYYVSLPSVLDFSTDLIVIFAQFLTVISYCLEIFFVSFTAMTIGIIRAS
jgi:hypothetical protein